MAIRAARQADAPKLAELWRVAGLRFSDEHVEQELRSVLARDPELVLVEEDGEDAGVLAGSVFGTFDGRRGWVNRLGTRPARRGEGIATALLAELERRLRAKGCFKINLLVEGGNAGVAGFYARLGYQGEKLIFMTKWLDPEPPAGARAPAGEPEPDAAWRALQPELHGEPYVFAVSSDLPPGLRPFALIREDEGTTLVLRRDDADRAGLCYRYVAARVTLTINSSLEQTGLTATVSRALADAGISCNVIAGAAHDHLFVDWDRAGDAVALLRQL